MTEQRWQLLAIILLICAALYVLAPVITPFAVAAMFAYLFDPVADRLERLRLSRTAAVSIVFLSLMFILVLALLLLVPYLQRQIANFIHHVPEWVAWFQNVAVPWLNAKFDLGLEAPDMQQISAIVQEHWKEAGGFAAAVVATVSKSGYAFVSWMMRLIVVPVVFFYLLRDWHVMIARIGELMPRSIEPTVKRLSRESDETLSAFVRGQLSVMIALGVLYAVGLWAVGIDVGPLIGMIAGLISFVPYLGTIVGVMAGLIAAFVQYQDWAHPLLVALVFVIGNLLEGYVLVPRLVGEKIGLHPVAVIFAILAGGELFGFLGVLLALPVASVAMVLLRYAHERYRASALYGKKPGVVIVAVGSAPVDPDAIVLVEEKAPVASEHAKP